MFQILLRGQIVGFSLRPGREGQKPTSIVSVSVKCWRQGESVKQEVLVTLDAYLTERFQKLKEDTKWITFRCSDLMPTTETSASGKIETLLWAKGEEYFL